MNIAVTIGMTCGLIGASALAAKGECLAIQALDLESGKITVVAAEPLPGHSYCGSPSFSADGKRVVFDATPGQEWLKTRLIAIEFPATAATKVVDVGPGNCPTWSPDGKQLAHLLHAGVTPDRQAGLWIVNVDGATRNHFPDSGLPKWSPDGRQILLVSFSTERQWTLLDLASAAAQPVVIPDAVLYSVPSWTGLPNQVVTVLRNKAGMHVALVDVSDPAAARITKYLWTRGQGLPDEPMYPVYSAVTKRLAFVGRTVAGSALFTVDRDGLLPRSLENEQRSPKVASLALSPEGRQLLFCRDATPAPN
jgi:Tol biopolymer transport system component